MEYITIFQNEAGLIDKNGKIISFIGYNTAFHCYIIADITEGLKKRLRGRFKTTADRQGRFGWTSEPESYVEVILYAKLDQDAKARNLVFFEKLGLSV
jgi:hypothetical protein